MYESNICRQIYQRNVINF